MTNASPRRSPLLLCLLALFTALSACIYDGHDGHGRRHGRDCPDIHACQSSFDCDDDQYCRQGTCRDLPPGTSSCSTSNQCGWKESCVDGVCCQQCNRDSDCGNGGWCDNGFCEVSTSYPYPGGGGTVDAGTPKPDAGTRDAGSGWGWPSTDAGTPRDAGTTTPPCGCSVDAGTSTADAGTPKDAGTPTPMPSTCRLNVDCGPGNYCINATCFQGCMADEDCGLSQMCSTGVCRPRPTPGCFSSAECAEGSDCVNGVCSVQCTSSTTCPANFSCKIGYCTEMPPDAGSGAACKASCECPSGERCVEGHCRI